MMMCQTRESKKREDSLEQSVRRKLAELAQRCPPGLFQPPTSASLHRLIVIDGCNVGRASCGPGRENVNCLGLLTIARFWIVRDFDVVIFIPAIYNNPQNQNVAHSSILPKLQTLGILGFTSTRTTGTRRRGHMNYDDLYVLDFAERHGGAVLSGDYFEDILNSNEGYEAFRDIIKRRRVGVRFHPFGEAFARSDNDHYYRCFPEIHSLSVSDGNMVNVDRLHPRLFAEPRDAEYQKSLRRRELAWSADRRQQLLEGIDGIIKQFEVTLNAATVVLETSKRTPRTEPVSHARPAQRRSSASTTSTSTNNNNDAYLNQLRVRPNTPNYYNPSTSPSAPATNSAPLHRVQSASSFSSTRSFSNSGADGAFRTGANAVPLNQPRINPSNQSFGPKPGPHYTRSASTVEPPHSSGQPSTTSQRSLRHGFPTRSAATGPSSSGPDVRVAGLKAKTVVMSKHHRNGPTSTSAVRSDPTYSHLTDPTYDSSSSLAEMFGQELQELETAARAHEQARQMKELEEKERVERLLDEMFGENQIIDVDMDRLASGDASSSDDEPSMLIDLGEDESVVRSNASLLDETNEFSDESEERSDERNSRFARIISNQASSTSPEPAIRSEPVDINAILDLI